MCWKRLRWSGSGLMVAKTGIVVAERPQVAQISWKLRRRGRRIC